MTGLNYIFALSQIVFKGLAILLTGLSFLGCATIDHGPFKTMNTDFSRDQLTRSQYYALLADNYLEMKEYNLAAEHFGLSLLHDKKNLDARLKLIESYIKLGNPISAFTEVRTIENEYFAELSDSQLGHLNRLLQTLKSYKTMYSFNQFQFEKTGSVLGLVELVEIDIKTRNFNQALENLKLLEINSKQEEVDRVFLYLAYSKIFRIQKDFSKSLQYLNKIPAHRGLDKSVLEEYFKVYYGQADMDNVVMTGKKLIKYSFRSFEFSEWLFSAALKTKDYDLALEEISWQRNIIGEKNKNNQILFDEKRLQLAYVHFLKGDYKTAQETYLLLVKSHIDENEVYYYLALSEFELSQPYQAIKRINKIDYKSNYFAIGNIRASRYEFDNQEPEAALERIREAYNLRPDLKDLHIVYSEYLIKTEKISEAVTVLDKGIKKFGYDEDLILNQAFCFYKLNNVEAFENNLNKVKSKNPQSQKFYAMLADLWFKDKKDSKDTKFFVQQALNHGSTHKELMKILAWTLVDQGDVEQAVALLEDLMDSHPLEGAYPKMLSEIYLKNSIYNRYGHFSRLSRLLDNKKFIDSQMQVLPTSQSQEHPYLHYTPPRLPAGTKKPIQ